MAAVGLVDWAATQAQIDAIERQAGHAASLQRAMNEQATERLRLRGEIIDNFGIDYLGRMMTDSTEIVYELMLRRNEQQAALRRETADLEAAKTDVLLSGAIDGKNAETRAAQMAQALGNNPVAANVDRLKAALDTLDAELEHARLRFATAKGRLAAATAALALLGS
jgi:hypothetical protein